jgi:Lar family restriction alleviation protein
MSETKGLYQLPDEPDDAPQGSVSQPVSALGRADAPLRECPFCGSHELKVYEGDDENGYAPAIECACNAVVGFYGGDDDTLSTWNRRDGEAARVAEAVAQEHARILDGMNALEMHDTEVPDGRVLTVRIFEMHGVIFGYAP